MPHNIAITNARIYTLNPDFEIAEALAISNGRITAVGDKRTVLESGDFDEIVDMGGKSVYPGFYDAHCHLLRYAPSLMEVDLTAVRSEAELLNKLRQFHSQQPDAVYIKGYGLDDTRWQDDTPPNKAAINRWFPNLPVMLMRVDLHAALVNDCLLQKANITAQSKFEGGKVQLTDGKLNGWLIDNALVPVYRALPDLSDAVKEELLLKAQRNLFEVGITSLADAHVNKEDVDMLHRLHTSGKMQLRVYCMIMGNEANKAHYVQNGSFKTERLHVRAMKYFADGALGSHGAWLLQPYSDQPQTGGFALFGKERLLREAAFCKANGFQMCVHAIGDAANKLVADVYGEMEVKGLRWRIEHAQIVAPEDFSKFARFGIIPSVQPKHATSDMFWVRKRLGAQRTQTAYAYAELLEQAGLLAYGSDFPVEPINPILGFYAAVSRQNEAGEPRDGFQIENAITRHQALQAMTTWAAYACFEENEKGSLQIGRFADFVVTDRDIMEVPLREIPQTRVLQTYIAGERVF